MRSHLTIVDETDPLVFYSGNFSLCQRVWGFFPLSLLLDLVYLVLCWCLDQLGLELCTDGKYGSIFIFLHINWQHYLWNMLSFFFFTVCFCLLCQRSSVHRCVGLLLGFDSIPSIDLSVSVPIAFSCYPYCFVLQLEVKYGDFPQSCFIVENCFGCPGFFFSMWSWEFLFPCLWRIKLELYWIVFWWELYWICRILLVRWPFSLC
jgi:hypothetical protein